MNAPRSFASLQVQGAIGGGSETRVYRAWDPQLTRPVALKVLRREWARDRQRYEQFVGEARMAAALEHNHIVKVYGVGVAAGQPYIAYQYVDGPSLARRLQDGPMGLEEVVELLQPVAEALDHAHGLGYYHGDIKPSNILIDKKGTVRLSDFGITSHASQGGVAGGTPEYMAPELFNRAAQSVATDVYALGVTAFEMLVGQPPFVGDPMRLAFSHAHQSLPAASGISKCAFQALRKAMAKQPEERWESAGAFVEALACRDVPWLVLAGVGLAGALLVAGLLSPQPPGGGDGGTALPVPTVSTPVIPATADATSTIVIETDTPPAPSTATAAEPAIRPASSSVAPTIDASTRDAAASGSTTAPSESQADQEAASDPPAPAPPSVQPDPTDTQLPPPRLDATDMPDPTPAPQPTPLGPATPVPPRAPTAEPPTPSLPLVVPGSDRTLAAASTSVHARGCGDMSRSALARHRTTVPADHLPRILACGRHVFKGRDGSVAI